MLTPRSALMVALGLGACASDRPHSEATGLPDLPPGVQAVSLLGDTLTVLDLSTDVALDRQQQLVQARAAYEATPEDADSIIWFGRRLAYLGRYRDAIATYTEGIAISAGDARMYRHRGHRYISVRELDRAIGDFVKATRLLADKPDEVEPDGLPNARGIPTSTLQFNSWYHLGLAHYLKGDFERALSSYRECVKVSRNPDALSATSYWLYMTLRRLGREEEAAAILEPIHADMDIIENYSYHRLLLMYKGELPPDQITASVEDALENATVWYGIGNWHLFNGREEEAMQIFRRITRGPQWSAFGYIAAEAELARAARRP